jgi:glycosyltransferase involved in cell wall biosynthesis
MTDPIRVLYVHPFAVYGGATKSLAEMFRALPAEAVQGTAIAPSGVAARSLADAGLDVIVVRGIAQWDDTRFGHYRGLRWLILLRELAYWPATIKGLREAASRGPYDLIHCNEITALLAGILAKRMLRAPLVVHVRSLQRGTAGGRISSWLHRLIRKRVDALAAIDEAVRRTLPADLPVEIIHNGMAMPAQLPQREGDDRFCVGIIGVLHHSKGVYELLEAARLLRDRGVAIRVLVVGENVHSLSGLRGWLLRKLDFARDVRRDLEAFVEEHALQDVVEFTGFVTDVRAIYSRTDVVCFPSHLDAPGRPVFEAALFGRPTIVAMRNPTSDVVVPGVTGVCIDEPTPAAIAAAIDAMARDRAAARAMGDQARRMALKRFESRVSAAKVLELYGRVCARVCADQDVTSAARVAPPSAPG